MGILYCFHPMEAGEKYYEKGRCLDMRKIRGVKKAALLALGLCGLIGGMASAAPQENAKEELAREQGRIYQEASKEAAEVKSPQDISVNVTEVVFTGNKRMSEDELRFLLPELKKDKVNIRRLSRQIQMANDTGSMKLGADFKPDGAGGYRVTVSVEEKKSEHVNVTVDNTGNYYSGDWRATLSYLATNATNHADSFGVAAVSSPGHWDDVKQAAVSYRMMFPKDAGALSVFASWSDVNLGNVSGNDVYQYLAGGRGVAVGVHGQKFFSYTSRNKDILDIGIEHKSYENDNQIVWPGVPPIRPDGDYQVTMLSAAYIHNDRSTHHSFTYNLGLATNLNAGHEQYYQVNNCDKNFLLWKGGVAYQYKTKGDWLIGLRLHGQYTKDNVVPSEQLGAGGLYTVRGFNERTVSGDTGLVGSFEIFTPEFFPNSRFCIFTDYGTLHNNNERINWGSETLGSVGLGYRYTDVKNGWAFRLEYAKIVDDVREDLIGKQGHKNWNVSLTKSF